jgi:VWFA-related protein
MKTVAGGNVSSTVLLAILAVFLAPTAWPQASSPPATANPVPQDSGTIPTFKNRTEIVLVPVVVRDKHGKPVTGLTKDTFHLEENGKEQKISSFEEVAITASIAPAPAVEGSYSNLPLDASRRARVTIFVIDLINTSELQRTDAKERLIKFFSKDVLSGEPVSLLCLTTDGVKVVHPFTSDPSLLVQALQKLKVEHITLGYRRGILHETLKQLREIAAAYAGIPGRKSLIWAAGHIDYPTAPGSAFGDLDVAIRDEFEETWGALLSANIAVYPFGLLSPAPGPGVNYGMVQAAEQTRREFAVRTGGALCEESGDLSECFNKAIEDSRSYYLLSYALAPDDRKPGWRKIKVNVSTPSVDVRAREGFYYGPPVPPDKPVKPHADEIAALASSLAASAILINVRVLPPPPKPEPPSSSGKVTRYFQITIPLESVTVDPSLPDALDLEVGAIALDKKMKEAGEFLHPVKGNPKPETLKQFAQDGIRLQEKMDLQPGAYDMRFVVRDNATGKIGTVVFPLELK